MSIFKVKTLQCPRCGAQEVRNVLTSLDLRYEPDRREEILSARFQRFSCGTCSHEYRYEGPFSYSNLPEREFLLVYPPSWEESWRALEAETLASFERSRREAEPSFASAEHGAYFVRLVFGMEALREKLLCRRAGIDDVYLEALKVDVLRGMAEELPPDPRRRPRLLEVDSARMWLNCGTNRRPLGLPRGTLAEIAESQWRKVLRKIAGEAYVDIGRMVVLGSRPVSAVS